MQSEVLLLVQLLMQSVMQSLMEVSSEDVEKERAVSTILCNYSIGF